MDYGLFWKALTVFNFLFFLLWVIFYTYQPRFMKDSDFVAPGATTRGASSGISDRYLSDPGRSMIFLTSILTSVITVIVVIVIMPFFYRRTVVKCKKGAKNLGDCKFEKV